MAFELHKQESQRCECTILEEDHVTIKVDKYISNYFIVFYTF